MVEHEWRGRMARMWHDRMATRLADRSEAFSYPTINATPTGPLAVFSATAPVRAGVAFRPVAESHGSTTASLTSSSTDQPASHGPWKHVATLRDRVLLDAEVAHRTKFTDQCRCAQCLDPMMIR